MKSEQLTQISCSFPAEEESTGVIQSDFSTQLYYTGDGEVNMKAFCAVFVRGNLGGEKQN